MALCVVYQLIELSLTKRKPSHKCRVLREINKHRAGERPALLVPGKANFKRNNLISSNQPRKQAARQPP